MPSNELDTRLQVILKRYGMEHHRFVNSPYLKLKASLNVLLDLWRKHSMDKQMSLHVKTRLWTPKGYDDYNNVFKLTITPDHILTIPLDARGKSFVRIKLTSPESKGK